MFFHGGAISIEDYKALMVPSLEIVYAKNVLAAKEFDILEYTMEVLPKLKKLQ